MDGVILLADRKSDSWDLAEKIHSYLINEKELEEEEIPLEEVLIGHFNNGEIKMKNEENVREKKIFFIHDSNKNPQEWWVQLLLLKDLLLRASVSSLSLVLPDMYYSRQDRKDESRVPISSSALSDSISPGLKRIITMDLHSAQIQGAYPQNVPIDNLYSFPEAVKYFREHHKSELENLVVVAPDTGGARRTKSFLKRLRSSVEKDGYLIPLAIIDKDRVVPGEVKEMELVGNVDGKNCLIVDDIYDSCGTMIAAGRMLKQRGAQKLMAYATHGLFTKGTEEITSVFDVVVTSNTHYQNPEKRRGIEVVDISPVFGEVIYRVQKGMSISKLFE